MPAKEPVTELNVQSKSDGDTILQPDELVLGVTIDGVSRAYPLNMMKGPSREVLNDRIGEKDIVVTWCSLCFTNCVFDRTVDNETLEFGIAGMLWNQNAVMYDTKTRSLWTQALGKSMTGPSKGKQLTLLKSIICSWSEWSKKYPETTVVIFDRTTQANTLENYKNSKSLVIGIPKPGGLTFSLWELRQNTVENAVWNDQGVLAVCSKSGTARVFSRESQGTRLAFQIVKGRLEDQQTHSTWDRFTGQAIDGPLAGTQLDPIDSVMSFRHVWKFHFAN